MIRSFKNRGLKRLWNRNDASAIDPRLLQKVQSRLSALNVAAKIEDLNMPGFYLHKLKGTESTWSIRVSGNWRITFHFENGDAYSVDLADYH